MTLHVSVFHNLTDFIQTKGEGPQRRMILFRLLMSTPDPNVAPMFTALNGIYVTSSTSVTISTITATAGWPAVVGFWLTRFTFVFCLHNQGNPK